MTHSPTPEERAALKVAHAATGTPDASYDLVSAIVFALGSAQLLQSPETADEVAALRGVAELMPFVSALEVPRPGNRLPLLLQRVYGTADRWFISDREGRRWHRLYGWVCESGGLTADEHTRDAARFTLAEAVPTARLIVQDEAPEALHASSGAVIEIPARPAMPLWSCGECHAINNDDRCLVCRAPRPTSRTLEDPHDSELHHDYRTGRDLPEVTP